MLEGREEVSSVSQYIPALYTFTDRACPLPLQRVAFVPIHSDTSSYVVLLYNIERLVHISL